MSRPDSRGYRLASHNHAGCRYLNQTGFDAVQGWMQVLHQIDPRTLPAELQHELRQLQRQGSSEKQPDERCSIR